MKSDCRVAYSRDNTENQALWASKSNWEGRGRQGEDLGNTHRRKLASSRTKAAQKDAQKTRREDSLEKEQAKAEAKSRSKKREINQNHSRKWIAILKWLRLPISIATESTKGLSWGRREVEWTFAAKQTWVITLAVCSPKPTKEKLRDLFSLKGDTHPTVEQARF